MSAGLMLALMLTSAACGSSHKAQPAVTTTSGPASTTAPAPSTSAPATTSTPAPTTTIAPSGSYQPLFPFASLADLADWQRQGGPQHQPWRLEPGATALAFAAFLGYSEIDRVVKVSTDTKGTHVAIGYATEGSHLSTAAIVHLVRYGSGANPPWEVVGTDDTDFTIETPKYGAAITSPVLVGGHISGVDESITVHVQQLRANGSLGTKCCVAAGGQDMPWSVSVPFGQPTDRVLIISAETGGHIQGVERFAVTGVTHG